jgi:hypothetical protein
MQPAPGNRQIKRGQWSIFVNQTLRAALRLGAGESGWSPELGQFLVPLTSARVIQYIRKTIFDGC